MNREIGSNFYKVELSGEPQKDLTDKVVCSFSGRTSLSQVLDSIDIPSENRLKSVWLPSYCCDSMIQPFLAKGMGTVSFYDVCVENNRLKADINTISQADIILTLNYFGTGLNETEMFEKELREKFPDAVIIKDITHSMLSDGEQGKYCDCMFGSVRKWSGFADGGIVVKKGGFKSKPYEKLNEKHFELSEKAQKSKELYIEKGEGDKFEFLNLFGEAEELLDEDYLDYAMSRDSFDKLSRFDWQTVAKARRRNYGVLMSASEIMAEKNIIPLADMPEDGETPLFFPVLAENKEKRDNLRRYLIENSVYCPVHWPISNLHLLNEATREIYDRELSLICDQRYTEQDMKRIVELIERYEEK